MQYHSGSICGPQIRNRYLFFILACFSASAAREARFRVSTFKASKQNRLMKIYLSKQSGNVWDRLKQAQFDQALLEHAHWPPSTIALSFLFHVFHSICSCCALCIIHTAFPLVAYAEWVGYATVTITRAWSHSYPSVSPAPTPAMSVVCTAKMASL